MIPKTKEKTSVTRGQNAYGSHVHSNWNVLLAELSRWKEPYGPVISES